MPWPATSDQPVEAARQALGGLFNIVEAAQAWGVARLGIASTIGVYGGLTVEGPLREDMPLPMTYGHVIPAFKKIGELLAGHLAETTGIEIVNYRISAIWGPLGRVASPFFAAPQLVQAAVRGSTPDLSTLRLPAHADDSTDLCYVKDCGRAIALLQLADQLTHRTYNVASGRATTNAEVIASIRKVIPDAQIELPASGTTWTSPGSSRTPDTSPPTAPTARSPTTSPGCGPATSAEHHHTGRVRGSPNRGRTLLSVKPVITLTRSPERVSTIIPYACATGVCGSVR
jgi:nucleoside-diphosphate-sugar epimerase